MAKNHSKNLALFNKMKKDREITGLTYRELEKKFGVYNGFYAYYSKESGSQKKIYPKRIGAPGSFRQSLLPADMVRGHDLLRLTRQSEDESRNMDAAAGATFCPSAPLEAELCVIAEILSSSLSLHTQKTLVKQIATRL